MPSAEEIIRECLIVASNRTGYREETFVRWRGRWQNGDDRSADTARGMLRRCFINHAPDEIKAAVTAAIRLAEAIEEATYASRLTSRV